jgi:hypothetical protein
VVLAESPIFAEVQRGRVSFEQVVATVDSSFIGYMA